MRLSLLLTLTSVTLIVLITFIILTVHYQEYILNYVYYQGGLSNDIIIQTKNGNVRGFAKREAGLQYYQFLGIPFAEPPINQNRFQKPRPLSNNWTGVYVADRWPDFCKQINLKQYEYLTPVLNYNTSEDCLYLNIWTPIDIIEEKGTPLKPVVVYVHGGAFMYMGTSFEIFNGGVFSALGDVVFVIFNYRVGVFGFLDTGSQEEDDDQNNESVPKNIGLYDQIMALNWVRDNIKQLGGDANSVTLMGQSAGAISIGLLMSSPLASDLFERAIMESSSPMQMKFFYQISKTNYKRVLQLTNCSRIQCLRELNENDLNAVHNDLRDQLTSFSPSIPSELLPQFPRETFDYNTAEYDVQQKQILLGSNSEEGAIFLHHIRPEQFPLDELPNIKREGVVQLFKELGSGFHQNISDDQMKMMIENTLGINGNTPEEIREQLSTLIGDFLFKCPVIKMADSLSEWPNVTVYMYYFSERSGNWPEWIGSSHFEEVQFVFGFPLRFPDNYTKPQQDFTRRLIKTWTQFARNGQMLDQLGTVWPKYSAESGQHMELNSQRSSIGSKLNQNYYLLYEIGFETL